MHILFTGGTGLIGSALIQRCLPLDYRFTVLTRKLPGPRAGVSCVQSLHDIPVATRFDAVINLAGEPIADARWTEKRKHKLINSRVGTTQLLNNFLATLEHTPPVMISGSAVGWYGDQGDKLVTEDTDPHDEFSHELCKLWEDAALTAERMGLRVCVLRTGLVLAKNGGFLKRMLLPFKLGLGGRLGSGQQYMPWVHIDDIVSMILFLIEHETCFGAFNGTAPEPVSNLEFTRTLGKVLKRPTLFPMPALALKIGFGEMSQLLLTGQRAFPDRFVKAGYSFKYSRLEDALKQVV